VTSTVYLDSSAIVKVVVQEPGWQELEAYLREHPVRATSRIATVEVARVIARIPELDRVAVAERVRSAFGRLTLIEFDADVAAAAMRLRPASLRTLDAIHVASAMEFREELTALVTYDARMTEAATGLLLPTAAP
jgi:predicted nucleic acid-binding protein